MVSWREGSGFTKMGENMLKQASWFSLKYVVYYLARALSLLSLNILRPTKFIGPTTFCCSVKKIKLCFGTKMSKSVELGR